jgi:MinD superfamily P-loop ATPase
MKEIVIVSGKGGTGKTSLVASFAALAERRVLADCDVDAADLHLLMAPVVQRRSLFTGGRCAVIRPSDCAGCGVCLECCQFDAVEPAVAPGGSPIYRVDPVSCEGCRVCVRACPNGAIDFPERTCGEWFVSKTRWGPMVHARLDIGAENSGKLVTIVRREARALAEAGGHGLVLVDGPPGIGCPVIASITGASLVLVVTEPTLSGEHDLERVLTLAAHFGLPTAVLVNKWDLNPEMTERIERRAAQREAKAAGRIRYDPVVTEAQIAGMTVVEYGVNGAVRDIEEAWNRVCAIEQ